ncbi:MAG TPA: hypothetical protein VLC50_05950 [Actinomycetes bacterium]|nr:hypothetical protein [Actinomycetes bacterium]
MATIAWLGIPLAATLLAIVWVVWVSRPRPPADMHETLASYERFKAAMSGDTRRRWRRRPGSADRRRGQA